MDYRSGCLITLWLREKWYQMRSLYSRGIGLTDAHLIASCFIHPSTLLWTCDKRLSDVAEALGIAADLP